jgi:hypothetical protein
MLADRVQLVAHGRAPDIVPAPNAPPSVFAALPTAGAEARVLRCEP